MRASLASEKIRGAQGCFRMGLATSLDSTEINSMEISEECPKFLQALNSFSESFNFFIESACALQLRYDSFCFLVLHRIN